MQQHRRIRILPLVALLIASATITNTANAQGGRQLRTADRSQPGQAQPVQDVATQTSVDTVIAALIEAAKSDNEDIQIGAYAGLGNFMNDRPELVALFIDAAQVSEGRVKDVVIRNVAQLKSPTPEVAAIVVQYLASNPGEYYLVDFVREHHEISVPLLIEELLSDREVTYRENIVEQLRSMAANSNAAIQPLLTILADEDEPPSLRAKVAYAVALISKAHADVNIAAAEAPNRRRESAMQMMQQMDTNGDGKIDVTELPVRGGDSQFFFRRMDADGDGSVTLEELMNVIGGTGR